MITVLSSFHTVATNALVLDGIVFHGAQLRVKRPRDYVQKFESGQNEIGSMKQKQESDSSSRVLLLKNMASMENISNESFYKELFDDVQSCAAQFGPIITTIIPKPPVLRLVFYFIFIFIVLF